MNETESEVRSMAETEKPAVKTRQSGIKRIFAKKVTSVSISDTNIKLTVFQGDELKKWVTCPLETGVVVNGIVQDTDSLSSTLTGLLKDNKVNTSKLIFGLSGLHAITRTITLPRVPQKVLREAIVYEAERELPVPIDSIYLFWQIIEGDSQEIKVFLVAYAQNTIDGLMNTLRKAGIKPYLLELAPLAIARCVNSPTSIVFDVRPGELDIVVTIDNSPELIRSVPLPPYNLIEDNLPTILPIVLDELQRTITFCKSARSIESLPIFGFGDLGSEIFESLSTALNHPIALSYPPLQYSPEFSPDTCIVNLGLALGQMKLSDYARSQRVNINLLPEHLRTRFITQKTLAVSGATVACGILVAILVLWLLATADTDSFRSDLAAAEKTSFDQQLKLTKLEGEVNSLTATKDRLIADYNALNGSRGKRTADQTSINNDLKALDTVLKTLPSGTALNLASTIGYTDLVMTGSASSQNQVLNYVSTLEDSDLFSEIVLSMAKAEGIAYTLQLHKGV